ncbi:hypothetical protein Q0590_35165 [Rhodocytophaga aerolata]|uniref:Lipoprotein n=1 Tax=Rhodocytophaga aerolata TaxID=455078 RepID=A0ABT8RHJ5_9BACT|nr:hypothetical protein [Rhodocytophaga aerolata]MDO1451566.1 hypothetical protein [Rhodocytophaga aerolata]
MKTKLLVSIILLMSISCRGVHYQSVKDLAEKERVEACWNNWKVESTSDTLHLKLLMQDQKGRHGFVRWPNFFIGLDAMGDTIGIVEYNTTFIYKRGDTIQFKPSAKKQSPEALVDSEMDYPILRVSKKKKENDLYCSVKRIYYGELIK